MDVGKPPRKSIRRPVNVISAADGEPPIAITPRQIAIGKMIGAAIGAVPVAILLLGFHSNTGSASSPEAVTERPDPVAGDVARVKAEAQANAEGKEGVFFTSCAEVRSGNARVRQYRQLSYEDGKVRESTSAACDTP